MKVIYNPFVKFVKFKKWWADRLSARPNKLIDLGSRKPMTLNKRTLIEKPKMDDLWTFLINEGLDVLLYNKGQECICKVNGKSKLGLTYNIIRNAESPSRAIKLATLDYLKEDFYKSV